MFLEHLKLIHSTPFNHLMIFSHSANGQVLDTLYDRLVAAPPPPPPPPTHTPTIPVFNKSIPVPVKFYNDNFIAMNVLKHKLEFI